VKLSVRPITSWPGVETTVDARRFSQFKATYSSTLDLLDRELTILGASNVVVELWVDENDVRLNGELRANAQPDKPGVILSFDSKHVPLRYTFDVFESPYYRDGPSCHHNLRAIALGLQALRRLDRYGIATRAEQYTGWRALGAGIAIGQEQRPHFDTIEEAADFLIDHGEWGATRGDPKDLLDSPIASDLIAAYYRMAAKRLHPDTGGDPEDFARLCEARRALDERQDKRR